MDCSLPASSVHGIFQARVLEWGAITFSNKQSTEHIYIYMEDHLAIKEWPADTYTKWINLRCIIISERSQPYILSDSVYMMLLKRQTYRNRNQQNSGCLGWGRVDSKAAVWGTVVGNGTIPCLSMRADTRLYVFVRIYRTVYQEKQILLHVNFYKWKFLNNYFFWSIHGSSPLTRESSMCFRPGLHALFLL